MKLKLFITALIVAFAATAMADDAFAGGDGLMQVAQKKQCSTRCGRAIRSSNWSRRHGRR